MKITKIKVGKLLKAGYVELPVHFDNDRYTREFVLSQNMMFGFPRFHIVEHTDGSWDIHYDVHKNHNNGIPGSIIDGGTLILREIDRIKGTECLSQGCKLELWQKMISDLQKKIEKHVCSIKCKNI